MAVFTLPPEMMYFYKNNIEFITDHAPDPDKMKFVDPHEGPRHFIDIDVWGTYPYDDLPKNWYGVMEKYIEIYHTSRDTVKMLFGPQINKVKNDTLYGNNISCNYKKYKDFIDKYVAYRILEDDVNIEKDTLAAKLGTDLKIPPGSKIIIKEHFTQDGILPYRVMDYYRSLVKAFEAKDAKKILRISTNIGHYVGDLHVPLHTTKNYNGQLTNQVGIHAFWENGVPELYGETDFDYLVGKAEYLEDINGFVWKTLLKSHKLKDIVLQADSIISKTVPENKKFEFRERNGNIVKVQSEYYIGQFNKQLTNMVESRMREAIKALGSIWFSAWIDAGQPELRNISGINWSQEEEQELESIKKNPGTGELHGCGGGN